MESQGVENSLGKSSLSTISVQPDSQELVRQFLVRFGEIFRQPITSPLVSIWMEHFAGVSPEVLETALRRAEHESEFFPTPASVMKLIDRPEVESETLDAEKAWAGLEKRRREWGADLTPLFMAGELHHPPPLDAPTEYALAAIGGWSRFCDYDLDTYAFLRRDFIAAFKRFRETGGLLAPSREEAKRLLAQVRELPASSVAGQAQEV